MARRGNKAPPDKTDDDSRRSRSSRTSSSASSTTESRKRPTLTPREPCEKDEQRPSLVPRTTYECGGCHLVPAANDHWRQLPPGPIHEDVESVQADAVMRPQSQDGRKGHRVHPSRQATLKERGNMLVLDKPLSMVLGKKCGHSMHLILEALRVPKATTL